MITMARRSASSTAMRSMSAAPPAIRHSQEWCLAYDDIDQFVGHGDDFADLLAAKFGLNLLVRQGQSFDLLARRACRHHQSIPQFAVDLDHDRNRILGGDFGIEGGPGLLEGRA